MGIKNKKIEFKKNKNNCFICTSHAKNKYGYPRYSKDKKRINIHRHIYEECFGEIPEGMVIRHKCDNPSCINPEHLEIGTQQENMNDMTVRGRSSKGSKNGRAKLTEEQMLEIRKEYSEGHAIKELTKKYNVHRSTIHKIVSKRSWTHI